MAQLKELPAERITSSKVEGNQFPKDPQKRFEIIFSALGNSEAHCLTMLCLSKNPTRYSELYDNFLEASDYAWTPKNNIPAEYCRQVLIPAGLVVRTETDYNYGHGVTSRQSVYFSQTDAGVYFGHPVAAYLLEQSSKLPFSLLRIFGHRATVGETLSILNRAKILELLTKTKQPQRRKDIAESLNLHPTLIGIHLRYLAKLGLVDYSSVNSEERGFAPYRLTEEATIEKLEDVGNNRPLLTTAVFEELSHGSADLNVLAKRLGSRYPHSTFKSLRKSISTVLSELWQQGLCQPELFSSKNQSQATIAEAGINIVSTIISPIKQSLADDKELLSWRRIPWQNYANEAISKYRQASGQANKRPLKEWLDKTQTLILQHPGIRPTQLKSCLDRNPIDLLRALLGQGKISKIRQGKAVGYYPS